MTSTPTRSATSSPPARSPSLDSRRRSWHRAVRLLLVPPLTYFAPFDLTREEGLEARPKKLDFAASDKGARAPACAGGSSARAHRDDGAGAAPRDREAAQGPRRAPQGPAAATCSTGCPATASRPSAKAARARRAAPAVRRPVPHPATLDGVSEVINAVARGRPAHRLPAPNDGQNFDIDERLARASARCARTTSSRSATRPRRRRPGGGRHRSQRLVVGVQPVGDEDAVDVTDIWRSTAIIEMIRGRRTRSVRLHRRSRHAHQTRSRSPRRLVVEEVLYGAKPDAQRHRIGYIRLPGFSRLVSPTTPAAARRRGHPASCSSTCPGARSPTSSSTSAATAAACIMPTAK